MVPRITPILAIVFLVAIGMGIIIPIMLGLITELTGRAASEAALWGGLLTGAYAAMLFLRVPLNQAYLGIRSDGWQVEEHRRKPRRVSCLASRRALT